MRINKTHRPIIGLPACIKNLDDQRFHAVGEKYLTSIVDGMGGIPIIFPALGNSIETSRLLQSVDGLLFTGSISNVHPSNFKKPIYSKKLLTDTDRDATTLPLIKSAILMKIPILCICRGMQELNVAFGGTLFQHLPHVLGRMEHDVDRSLTISDQYLPRHPVYLEPDGLLSKLHQSSSNPMVNSLHSQGVDKLGDGLKVEAIAPDGQVEAITYTKSDTFALGVQWHPEWEVKKNPFYLSIFNSFLKNIKAQKLY
ncbi:MAG: gamma-glutamyl-gamma-aminobutyrate hydrolase [Rhodospirillaceae bacterium]|nr:gamma-glutamyl-gamma-aminobutyrate hydrolase [Alphaproteobacteria bacterium]MBR71916.1 gamma-glutamyl-gamma-aminobutyrate hydrolase [Rhodospirillaceae bacterium]|tara:strand:- start:2033 stop:2797 length:765 start_codon:yes stop_codon:yes gene_type:complete